MEYWDRAELWMNTFEEDPDVINKAYEGVKGLIAQNFSTSGK